MSSLQVDSDGVTVKREFKDLNLDTIGTLLDDVFAQIDILTEHAQIASDSQRCFSRKYQLD